MVNYAVMSGPIREDGKMRSTTSGEPRYCLEHGIIVFTDSLGHQHIVSGNRLAIAYDRADGTLISHGDAHLVEWRVAHLRRAFVRVGLVDTLVVITIYGATVTAAAIDEINACLATTGRIANLERRLQELSDRAIAAPTAIAESRKELCAQPTSQEAA